MTTLSRLQASHLLQLTLVCALAVLMRVLWIQYYPTGMYAESAFYFSRAGEIARGAGYVLNETDRIATAVYPVGYPMFLGFIFLLTGQFLIVAKYVNIILTIVLIAATYVMSRAIVGHRCALIASMLIAVLPNLVFYANLVSTEMLFVTSLMAAMVLIVRPSRNSLLNGLLVGILIGCAALTRPTALFLPAFALFMRYAFVGRKSLLPWLVGLLATFLLIVGAWSVRNFVHFGKFIPGSTHGGLNFWRGNHPGLAANGWVPAPEEWRQGYLTGRELEVDAFAMQEGWRFIREDPRGALILIPIKIQRMLTTATSGINWNRSSAIDRNQPGGSQLTYTFSNLTHWLLILLAFVGMVSLIASRPKDLRVWTGLAFTAFWVVLSVPFYTEDRYAVPLLPFWAMYAGVGVVMLVRLMRHGNQSVRNSSVPDYT